LSSKWNRLLDVYAEAADDPRWRHLRRTGINFVPGDGPESAEEAKVMLVGEAPGAQENGQCRPFVGPSGRVLNDLLEGIGLQRRNCFVTNVVKFRPPGNRTPTGSEVLRALDTLRAEWSVIQPVLTIAVGAPAQLALNQRGMPHGRLRPFGRQEGHWVTSVYHPAFGLRKKQAQVWIENEWELLGEEIGEIGLDIQ